MRRLASWVAELEHKRLIERTKAGLERAPAGNEARQAPHFANPSSCGSRPREGGVARSSSRANEGDESDRAAAIPAMRP